VVVSLKTVEFALEIGSPEVVSVRFKHPDKPLGIVNKQVYFNYFDLLPLKLTISIR